MSGRVDNGRLDYTPEDELNIIEAQRAVAWLLANRDKVSINVWNMQALDKLTRDFDSVSAWIANEYVKGKAA